MNNFTTFFEKNSRIQNYVSRKFMVFAILITFSTNGFAASGLFDAYAIFSINNGANTYRQYSAVQGWSIGSFTYGSRMEFQMLQEGRLLIEYILLLQVQVQYPLVSFN
jgi:hypothetical protein